MPKETSRQTHNQPPTGKTKPDFDGYERKLHRHLQPELPRNLILTPRTFNDPRMFYSFPR